MPDEIVFEVRDSTATRAEPVSLEEAGLREREHLQEWVIANPDVLGEGVLIVTIEYSRWVTQSGSAERDRLDVLGLGTDGRLVVAELKRGRAPRIPLTCRRSSTPPWRRASIWSDSQKRTQPS